MNPASLKLLPLLLIVMLASCAHMRPEKPLLSADEHIRLASIYESRGETELALRHLRDAVRVNGKNPEAHFAMGNFFLRSKDYVEAERAYQLAIELGPEEGRFYNNLGWLYMEEGRTGEAEAAVESALEKDPEKSFIYLDTLGVIQTRAGNYAEAERNLKKAEAITPAGGNEGLAEIYSHLADLYEKTGETNKAEEIREKIKGL